MAARDDIDLMLYRDGELSAAETAAVELALKGSQEDRDKVTALSQVGEVVRTHLELAADDAEPALVGLWQRIEQQVAAGSEAEAAVATAPRRAPAARVGIVAAIRAWLDSYRGHLLTGVVSAGAVAALILALRPPTERVVTRTVQAPPVVEAYAASAPATVEYLDVVDGSGTILTLPGESDEEDTTTVIWIDPNEDTVEGPI